MENYVSLGPGVAVSFRVVEPGMRADQRMRERRKRRTGGGGRRERERERDRKSRSQQDERHNAWGMADPGIRQPTGTQSSRKS